MLRMRRYRIFLILSVFVIAALYHFRRFGDLEISKAGDVDELRNLSLKTEKEDSSAPASPEPPVAEYQEQISLKEQTQGGETLEKEVQDKGTLDKQAQDLYYDVSTSKAPSEASLASPAGTLVTQTKDSPSSITSTTSLTSDQSVVHRPNPSQNAILDLGASNANYLEAEDTSEQFSEGREDIDENIRPTTIHWSQQIEHFPVPSTNIIQLPTGRPKEIPKIQHTFSDESASEKIAREQKLDIIKKTFAHSWAGYKRKAWMHDELTPVSGNYRDPFCGWAATLVDSLDSLWILGMKDEFEEATNALGDIDFTTTERSEIPLFETVIRYLGGLIAAYDLSGGAYRILLDKAVELAEILMGAFDTPNRMPMTFYPWRPAFASQPHRARTRTVLAELGSLSLEFTRLAQITRKSKYYDAVARITNELEIWQNNTKIPGLWPIIVDASGCKKPDTTSTILTDRSPLNGTGAKSEQSLNPSVLVDGRLYESNLVTTPKDEVTKPSTTTQPGENSAESVGAPMNKPSIDDVSKPDVGITKRQLYDENVADHEKSLSSVWENQPDCEPQGLVSPPGSEYEEFTLGGMADSVYEYLPKQYMLLGGLEDIYRHMYEAAVGGTKAHLLFRPMLPGGRNVLLSGRVKTSGDLDNPLATTLRPEGTHLTCFAGGMFAIGAKIFDRDKDMEIAKKLADGCVWAYESTATGIMPEGYLTVPCASQESCTWNETKYHEALDPHRERREETRAAQQQQLRLLKEQQYRGPENFLNETNEDKQAEQFEVSEATPISSGAFVAETTFIPRVTSTAEGSVPIGREKLVPRGKIFKRQLGDIGNEVLLKPADKDVETPTIEDVPEPEPVLTDGNYNYIKNDPQINSEETQLKPEPIATWTDNLTDSPETDNTPENIPTHKQFVRDRIRDERLPAGMTKITANHYILRPEAIESVFIMYRTTGEMYWREKGWAMFQAIQKHTNATFGASAIYDVTQNDTALKDEMESFWLAETIKYFFLLFSDPGVISLDHYVLNTEAHPFKRPRAA